MPRRVVAPLPRGTLPTVIVAVVSLGSIGHGTAAVERSLHIAVASPARSISPLSPTLCPQGTLPDGNVCVHLPDDDEGAPETESTVNAHHDKRGRWVVYDQIPRRPDRPADYDAYRYPVPCDHGCVVSGYDLDVPDERQRRGWRLTHVGHGAVDLSEKRGTPVSLVALEHQEGDAEVVYVGPLFGTTVITRHSLREGRQLRDYLLFFGHLEAPSSGLVEHGPGATLKEGDVVGYVGDTGSPELVHLHLEARRVRDGVDVASVARSAPRALAENANSVVCDPRNVLPLK